MIVGSYTLLNTFERCARQAHHRFVLKDQKFVETEEIRWGTRVHEAMEARLNGKPLPDEMKHHEEWFAELTGAKAEVKLGVRRDWTPCGFFDKDVWFRGKLDVLLKTALGAVIIDWKTGKRREDADELKIFAALLKAHHPDLQRISGWYLWLKDRSVGRLHDLSDAKTKQAEITGRMERLDRSLATGYWPPHETPLCGWCSVQSCEFHPEKQR